MSQKEDASSVRMSVDASTRLSIDIKDRSRMSSEHIESRSNKGSFQRLVFADPVAFRYLEEDPSTTVLERRHKLEGYELYLVEQWACSRDQPTFVATAFTGDPAHVAIVGILGVPTDEDSWSPRLKFYMKAVSQLYARKKETPMGILMVTNLSAFPSNLTVIPVPDGDLRKHREDFIVNTNLKRMGCSGRAGLTLAVPTSATKSMFYALFKTSDHIPFYRSVIEMVKLCQTALTIFDELQQEYADGLLCDVTESAIGKWWAEFGTEQYSIEPSDGVLGPTTVAALLGLLMGARSRLSAYGAPVGKDPFDIANMKRGIAYFQKAQKLTRSRRLDRTTLRRLHKATAKAATDEAWRVQKAVKSTVAELSGKGGDLALDMAGGRENSTISDVETVDMEQFVLLVKGERAKWLWRGRTKKSLLPNPSKEADDETLVFEEDEQGGLMWSRQTKVTDLDPTSHGSGMKETSGMPTSSSTRQQSPSSMQDEQDAHNKKTVFKSVTGRMSDARSGFGRIKDAVGIPSFRSHHQKSSRDISHLVPEQRPSLDNKEALSRQTEELDAPVPDPKHAEKLGPQDVQTLQATAESMTSIEMFGKDSCNEPIFENLRSSSEESLPSPVFENMGERQKFTGIPEAAAESLEKAPSTLDMTDNESVNILGAVNLWDRKARLPVSDINPILRRSLSTSVLQSAIPQKEAWWPRHLSFSVAEEAVLDWKAVIWEQADFLVEEPDPAKALKNFDAVATQAQHMRSKLADLKDQISSWVDHGLSGVEGINAQLNKDQEHLIYVYYQRLDEYDNLQTASAELLTEERNQLSDAIQEIDTLNAKMRYELNALATKVDDVEDGVAEFEKQVEGVEIKAEELQPNKHPESWTPWAIRLLTGMGPLVNQS